MAEWLLLQRRCRAHAATRAPRAAAAVPPRPPPELPPSRTPLHTSGLASIPLFTIRKQIYVSTIPRDWRKLYVAAGDRLTGLPLQPLPYTTTLLYPVTPRQGVCAFIFLDDFRSFSRIRAKMNENLREKGIIS